ncbi:MAG TPA: hypothetical protein VMS17_33300, partial [Gemmataceae bacterium]|nr:hypothetical protein [Gemmataceae bacterium]
MTRIRLAIPLLAAVLAAANLLNGPPLRAADKAPSDLALVPSNGAGFVSIRFADLMDSAAGKEFLQQMNKEKEKEKDKDGTGDLLADLHKQLIVPPGEIERLTFLLAPQVMIVRTVKPYDHDKLLDGLGGDVRLKRYKGKTLYSGADGQGLMPIDDDVFVRGSMGQLERLLDMPPAPEGPAALNEALETAAGKHHATIGVNPLVFLVATTRSTNEFESVGNRVAPAPTSKEPLPPPPPPPPDSPPKIKPPPCGSAPGDAGDAAPPREPDPQEILRQLPPEALPFKPLLMARSITLTFDCDGGLRVEGRAVYADKDQAADGETSAKTTLY